MIEEYEEDVYGQSTSPLHRGTPTDRFVAEWRLSAPHVERRISAAAAPLVRDSTGDVGRSRQPLERCRWLAGTVHAMAQHTAPCSYKSKMWTEMVSIK